MRRGRSGNLALKAILVVAILLCLDFLWFSWKITSPDIPLDVRADGIVALTGGGGVRIRAGVKLLHEGRAERLLVSGVNPDVDGRTVLRSAGAEEYEIDCCIDLGAGRGPPLATVWKPASGSTQTAMKR